MDIFSVLTLLGGLALFLYGMDVMGDGLKRLAGGRLQAILAKLTSNRLTGLLLGFGVTAIIQSSSATTVMLVGFVNSGIMTLGQTISVIMGANIGTTVTAWLLSLTGIGGGSLFLNLLKPSSFTPVLAVIGVVLIMFSKKDKHKNIASILLGFAVLMFGMEAMSDAVSGLKDSPAFQEILIMFENPVLGILTGTVLTAIIQSSSASVGILQALALTGAIPYSIAIPIILGQNIGTTITPILAAITGNTDSKRVAVSCLYIKMIGVVTVSVAFYALDAVFNFPIMDQNVTVLTIAIIHTLFNIVSTVILLPFCKAIETLAVKSIKKKKEQINTKFDTLDERFLEIPSFGLSKCAELVNEMMVISKDAFVKSTALINNYNDSIAEEIAKAESEVDVYEDKVGDYLVKLSSQKLSEEESHLVTKLLHCIGDIERISDHSMNVVEGAKEMHDKNITFSKLAQDDLNVISKAVCDILSLTTDALVNDDITAAKKVEPLEQVIDLLKDKVKGGHIERLKIGGCTVEMGFILSDILTNMERVADHCSNIGVCVLEVASDSFESHDYLNHVKKDGENEFFEYYEIYKNQYSL